jgi:plastocyanin
MDKAGIVIVLIITAVAVAFTATGGLGIESDTSTRTENSIEPVSELQLEIQVAKKASEDIQELTKEMEKKIEQTTEKAQDLTKEAVGAKLPAKFVSIPKGTSVPGCEKIGLCYDPPNVTIFVGGEILWRNDDLSPHTVTSGTAIAGPDGNFNSGLITAGQTFSNRFDVSGEFPYFCMIHPWAIGSVTVE